MNATGTPLPNRTLKNRLESALAFLKGRDPSPRKGGRDLAFYGVLLALSATVGFGFSLTRSTRHLLGGFLGREISDFRFDVFLGDSADHSLLEERFLAAPGVRSVRFVTREEALGRAHDDPALVDSLKLTVRNPLPESFEVLWDPSFLTPALVLSTADKWASLEGVIRVGFDRSRLERMALLQRVADELDLLSSTVLWGTMVSLVLGIGGLFFRRDIPFKGRSAVGAALVGCVGGGVGAAVLYGWLESWEPAGFLAGALVGLLGGVIRRRDQG